jgi:hypothetical protein
MYKGWAVTALALQPTVVYCAYNVYKYTYLFG